MKKAALTIAILLFGISTIFAIDVTGGPLKTNKALKTKVSQTITYPEFALAEKIDCTVYAIIKQETDGSVTVVQCDSKNGQMREYVREKLTGMNFESDNLEIGKEYTIRVDFEYMK